MKLYETLRKWTQEHLLASIFIIVRSIIRNVTTRGGLTLDAVLYKNTNECKISSADTLQLISVALFFLLKHYKMNPFNTFQNDQCYEIMKLKHSQFHTL